MPPPAINRLIRKRSMAEPGPGRGRIVWVTRAQPGAERTRRRLVALGFRPLVAPVLAITPLPIDLPNPALYSAIAFTSANAVHAFAARCAEAFFALPVFAVGAATAREAKAAGFLQVWSANGDAVALGRLLAETAPGHVLAPGATFPAADLDQLSGPAVRVTALPIYESVERAKARPETFDIVLIHSTRAADLVAARLSRRPQTGRIAVAISEAAARPLQRLAFDAVRIAARPTEAALLAELGDAELGKAGPTV
jgi:uroporphyrinogen-III synthase